MEEMKHDFPNDIEYLVSLDTTLAIEEGIREIVVTLFQALAVYVNNESIAQLLGEDSAGSIQPAKFIEVRLQRRQDLAQHLVSIAAITASTCSARGSAWRRKWRGVMRRQEHGGNTARGNGVAVMMIRLLGTTLMSRRASVCRPRSRFCLIFS